MTTVHSYPEYDGLEADKRAFVEKAEKHPEFFRGAMMSKMCNMEQIQTACKATREKNETELFEKVKAVGGVSNERWAFLKGLAKVTVLLGGIIGLLTIIGLLWKLTGG